MSQNIVVNEVPEKDRKTAFPDPSRLPFGKFFTDHMFQQRYEGGKWLVPTVKKLDNFCLHPAAIVLHYAQEIFEGMKCFRRATDGKMVIFRADRNVIRFNKSALRLCMPQVDPVTMLKGLKALCLTDARHVPNMAGTSLYLRPTMIGTEAVLGVRPSSEYTFYTIACTVGPYYPDGFKCIKIFVTRDYVRAAPGGTGNIKCGGNYAASLIGMKLAHKVGCSQVLWLDSQTRTFVEEVGAMNMMFVKDGKVYTPPLTNGTILPGVTRDSILTICEDLHIPTVEQALTMDEIAAGVRDGSLTEVFGTGTAASISPVGEIVYDGQHLVIGGGKVGPITQRLYDAIIGIQRGDIPDTHGWLFPVEEPDDSPVCKRFYDILANEGISPDPTEEKKN